MIDLTHAITQAQIAFALVVIAFSVAYYVFGRKSPRVKR